MNFLPLQIDNVNVYAGFRKRFAAGIIDFLVFIPFIVISEITHSLSVSSAIVTLFAFSLLSAAYAVYFDYKFGATLGKMAVDIKITFPDGGKIGLKQALLRSSVSIGFSWLVVLAQVIALTNADPEIYLNSGWIERHEYILPLFPAWYGLVNLISQLWGWSEFITLLFNKRKRAIHDFMAGTVVILKVYAIQESTPDSVAEPAVLMS